MTPYSVEHIKETAENLMKNPDSTNRIAAMNILLALVADKRKANEKKAAYRAGKKRD